MFRTILTTVDKNISAIGVRIFAATTKTTTPVLLGPTERTSTYSNNDSFDATFFASDNIILCDSYKQLIVEKTKSQPTSSITKGPLSLAMYRKPDITKDPLSLSVYRKPGITTSSLSLAMYHNTGITKGPLSLSMYRKPDITE